MAKPNQFISAPLVRRSLLILTGLMLMFGVVRLLYPLYRMPQLIAALRQAGHPVQATPLFSMRTHPWWAKKFNDVMFSGISISSDAHTSNEDLRLIGELFSLTYRRPGEPASCALDLYSTDDVTDAGLAHFRGVQQLRTLQLMGENITADTLRHLQDCQGLVCLRLGHTTITDRGLQYLQDLHNLTYLDLGDAKLTGAELRHLSGLTKLQELGLYNARITDADLAHVAGLTSLKSLHLGLSQIAGPGLQHLSRLTHLEELSLGETRLDDAGLAYLPILPALKHLDLSDTKVTSEGLRHLLKLPGHASLKITRPMNSSQDFHQRNVATLGVPIEN